MYALHNKSYNCIVYDVIFSAKFSKKRGNAVYLVFPQLDSKSILTYVQRSTAYVTQARDILYIYIYVYIMPYYV